MSSQFRSRAKSSPGRRTVLKEETSQVTSLVLIDAHQRRKKEWQRYQKLSQKYKEEAEAFRNFENDEAQAFRTWCISHFQPIVEQIQMLSRQIEGRQEIFQILPMYQELKGVSAKKAYAALLAAYEAGTLRDIYLELQRLQDEEEERMRSRQTQGSSSSRRSGSAFEDFASILEDMFGIEFEDEFFDEEPGEFRSQHHHSDSFFKDRSEKPFAAQEKKSEIKEVYHQLMMRLHPDRHPNQSEADRALYYASQEAYQYGALEELESILTQLSQGEKESQIFCWKTSPIGEILQRMKDLNKRLNRLRRENSDAKQHPAWGFYKAKENKKKFESFQKRTLADLQGNIEDLTMQWKEIQAYEKRFRPAKKPDKPSSATKAKKKTDRSEAQL